MNSGKAICVIPARWGSTRFPGKSLCLICGKPLVVRVYERALAAREPDEVVVATDDRRIYEAVVAAGGKSVMTSPSHASGTDRAAEAACGTDAALVVNVQGDEPLIEPALIDELVRALRSEPRWDMATAATPIKTRAEAERADVCKVVFDASGRALYFSRSLIPRPRDAGFRPGPGEVLWWRHIGIYIYRREFLERLVAGPRPVCERAEELEQLRALHIGGKIKTLITDYAGIGVDRPEDAAEAERLIKETGQ